MIKKTNKRNDVYVKTRNDNEPLGGINPMVVYERGEPTEERKQDLKDFILAFMRKEDGYRTARQSLEMELLNLVMREEVERLLTSDRTKIEGEQ